MNLNIVAKVGTWESGFVVGMSVQRCSLAEYMYMDSGTATADTAIGDRHLRSSLFMQRWCVACNVRG
jgi:hypothetical protein